MRWHHSLFVILVVAGISSAQSPTNVLLNDPNVPQVAPAVSEVQATEALSPAESLTEKYWFTRGAMLGWSKGYTFPNYIRVPIATGPLAPTAANQTDGVFLQGALGEAGMWFGQDQRFGAEIGGAFVFQGGKRVGPDPFFSADQNLAGLLTTEARTRFWTLDANFLQRLVNTPELKVDLLYGYRFAYLGEDSTVAIEVPTTGFGLLRYNDRADTKNQFHGGQIGLGVRYKLDGWIFDSRVKLAMGSAITQGELIGSSRALLEYSTGKSQSRQQLAQLLEQDSHFALMPSFNFRLSRQLTEHGRMYFGYEFLYLNKIARPDVILGEANAPQSANWTRGTTDYWLQGITLGMEWRY
jgi:hypothetical protein